MSVKDFSEDLIRQISKSAAFESSKAYRDDAVAEVRGMNKAIKIIKDNLKKYNDGWIRVLSYHKPYGDVLAVDEYGNRFVANFECGLKETKDGFVNCEDNYGYYQFATYWKHLPDAPKGEINSIDLS